MPLLTELKTAGLGNYKYVAPTELLIGGAKVRTNSLSRNRIFSAGPTHLNFSNSNFFKRYLI